MRATASRSRLYRTARGDRPKQKLLKAGASAFVQLFYKKPHFLNSSLNQKISTVMIHAMSAQDEDIKNTLGASHPIDILAVWLKEALKIKSLKEPWAGVLSTVSKESVSSRVVLLKSFKGRDLFFYTNYLSAKGQDMAQNPRCALNFYWPKLSRQMRIGGVVRKTTRKRSLLYWKTRQRSSQLSQWVSKQSQEVESRAQLEAMKTRAEKIFQGRDIPCPLDWGGYILRVHKIEFWKERKNRFHDRFVFEKALEKDWTKQRLFP